MQARLPDGVPLFALFLQAALAIPSAGFFRFGLFYNGSEVGTGGGARLFGKGGKPLQFARVEPVVLAQGIQPLDCVLKAAMDPPDHSYTCAFTSLHLVFQSFAGSVDGESD